MDIDTHLNFDGFRLGVGIAPNSGTQPPSFFESLMCDSPLIYFLYDIIDTYALVRYNKAEGSSWGVDNYS